MAQLQHGGDWQPAPQAMHNLMRFVSSRHKLDVALQKEDLPFNSPDIYLFKFLYMHGRKSFVVSADQLDNLRADLKTGGLLLADACCGKAEFDRRSARLPTSCSRTRSWNQFTRRRALWAGRQRHASDDGSSAEGAAGRAGGGGRVPRHPADAIGGHQAERTLGRRSTASTTSAARWRSTRPATARATTTTCPADRRGGGAV